MTTNDRGFKTKIKATRQNQDYMNDIYERKQLGEDRGHAIKEPSPHIKKYNYKKKYTGQYSELIQYSKPIYKGYQRHHKPERKANRTKANEINTKRARRKVHDIVNTNWTKYTKMITLTYAETMLDWDTLIKDFKTFRLTLKRNGYAFPYLAITEHQTERGKKENNKGSLHIHCLAFTDKYLPFKDLKHAWGSRGSVDVRKMDEVSNTGAYVSKYITKEGAPADKKSYRTSRNIKRPTIKTGLDETGLYVSKGMLASYDQVTTYDYTVPRGENQETGEILEDIVAKVTKYKRRD